MRSFSSEEKFSKPLYLFSLLLTGATVILILAGGLVTSHDAGLAVPDWPLSYGQLFPPMVGNVFWEHGHRMIAGTVGILTLLFAFTMQFSEKRTWLKRLTWAAFAVVVVQALLGGLTVLFLLPPAISASHATLAQTFFCLLLASSFFLSPYYFSLDPVGVGFSGPTGDKLKRLAYLTTGFIYLQLILGSIVRHTGHWHVIYLHIAVAFLVILHAMLLVIRTFRGSIREPIFVKSITTLISLITVQIFLGFGSLIFVKFTDQSYAPALAQVIITAAHQTTGALILGAAVFISLTVSVKK